MMGWRPHEVRECALPDFVIVVDGWLQAQGVDTGPKMPSEDELESMRQWRLKNREWVYGSVVKRNG